MRIRQILLVHPNRSIRALIKKYVFAELSDVAIVETETAENAMAELNIQPFDVVIASAGLTDMPALDLKCKLAATNHNSTTPMIILSEHENGDDQAQLISSGFEHVVRIRVQPAELIHKIDEVCNPRMWRKDKRFYIPGAGVDIHVQGTVIEGSLINISRGGVLVELITYDPETLMKSDIHLTLHFQGVSSSHEIDELACKLLRVNVTEWHPGNHPAVIRATFVFLDLPEDKIDQIERVLQIATEDNPEDESPDESTAP